MYHTNLSALALTEENALVLTNEDWLFLHNAQKGKITCIALNLCGLLRHFCHF